MNKFKNGPPGWIIALVLTLNILVCYHLAAQNYKSYKELWENSKVELCAWTTTNLAVWLTYRYKKNKRDNNDIPKSPTP